MRDITIQPASNGFIVKVGCRTLVFTSVDDLCAAFRRYQKDPEKVEQEYLKNELNKPTPAPPIELARPMSPREAEAMYEQQRRMAQAQVNAMSAGSVFGPAPYPV